MRTALLVLFYILLVIVATPFILFCILAGLREPLISLGKMAMGMGRRVLGLRIEIIGLERIDHQAVYIFMPNHISFLDGPLMFLVIPRPVRVILKKSAFKIPLIGWGMLHAGFVPVDRKGIRGGKKSIDRATALMRERGYSFLIFPEGTRSRDGTFQPLRRGGFFLALESGAPIVPVSISGTFELMPKGQWYARSGRVRIEFHDPIPVAGYTRETMEALIRKVRGSIASGIPAVKNE